jgi:hypothetical protein
MIFAHDYRFRRAEDGCHPFVMNPQGRSVGHSTKRYSHSSNGDIPSYRNIRIPVTATSIAK